MTVPATGWTKPPFGAARMTIPNDPAATCSPVVGPSDTSVDSPSSGTEGPSLTPPGAVLSMLMVRVWLLTTTLEVTTPALDWLHRPMTSNGASSTSATSVAGPPTGSSVLWVPTS